MSSPVSGAGPWDPVRGDMSRHDGDTTGSGHSGDTGDSPTLTMTLPPLLLHAGSVTSTAGPAPAPPLALGHRIHQDSTPSPAKLTSPCPLCSGNCSKFYCSECVIRGDFVHSSSALCERFSEKQLRFFSLQRDITNSKEEITLLARRKWREGELRENVKVTKTKIKYLKHVIKQNLERKAQNTELLQRFKDSVRKRQERIPLFREKADKMENFVDNFVTNMQEVKEKEMSSQLELRRTQADWILQLHDSIFPVDHVETDTWRHADTAAEDTDRLMMEDLADAMRTSYISGRWVNSDHRGEPGPGGDQYRIVSQVSPSCHTQHTLAAAHTMVAQFSSLAAAVVQLPLPVRLSWADLGLVETSEARLARKASKLNLNMVRLCLECGVDPRTIRPGQCLHNLFTIIQTLRSYNTVKIPGSCAAPDQLLDTLQAQLESEVVCSGGETEDSEDTDTEEGEVAGWGGGGGGWESVTADQVAGLGSVDTGPSIASSVSSTVSQLLGWGGHSTPHHSPQVHKK